jgi:hypothetical protein
MNTKTIDAQADEIFLDERVYLCYPVLSNAGILLLPEVFWM